MDAEGFSGWGVRTLARGEARYNPMSYHNGSVWPHDNALIALGFARYGLKNEAARIFEAMFSAATYQELRRLPELFCGFLRRGHRGPTAYPVACAPQAWASATPFGLLAACLGLKMNHEQMRVRFTNPVMPCFLDELVIRGLRLGGSGIDLRLFRHGDDVTLNVLSRRGDVRVMVEK
jgi:glycogen debranching enzyme